MDGIESMTRGWWRPSPGSIYPLLDHLTEDKLVKKRDDGRYELTKNANEGLEASFGPRFRKPQTVDSTMDEMNGFVSYFEDLSRSRSSELFPHLARLKALAKRLSALAGEGESETPSKS